MLETKSEIFFLDFIYQLNKKKIQTLTKARWKPPTSSVLFSHLPVETIVIDHLNNPIIASPFKIVTEDPETKKFNPKTKKIIEQNNYTNQSLVRSPVR